MIKDQILAFLGLKFKSKLTYVLTQSETDNEDRTEENEVTGAGAETAVSGSDARGFAWLQMDSSGLIKYHLKWNDLSSDLVSIQIDNG